MNDREHLDWLAFRYLANELDEPEWEAWERRLAEDQAAREAVARAFELTCAVSAAESKSAHDAAPPAPARWQGVGWSHALAGAALGAAACVALMWAFATWNGTQESESPVDQAIVNAASAERLAVIWSETREPLEDPLWPAEQLDELIGQQTVAEADPLPEGVPPSWILTAVFGLAGEQGQSSQNDADGVL